MSSPNSAANKQEDVEAATAAATSDAATRRPTQRITFEPPDERPSRLTRAASSRRRSASRDSISSVRSRTRSVSGIPIEFRTLSFQISESHSKRPPDDFLKARARADAGHKAAASAAAVGEKAKNWFHEKASLGKALRVGKKKKDIDVEGARAEAGKKGGADRLESATDSNYFENLHFHATDAESLCRELGVDLGNGLTSSEATTRLSQNGKNEFPARRENYAKKLFFYVFGGFCSVLWIGVIIFFICWRPLGDPNPAAYNLGLAILVLIVIFLQASFSAFQDWSTARTMKSILNLLPDETVVVRDGEARKLSATDLVAGDVVKISVGNKVPADMRLLKTSGDIRFDRSMLTGESEEVEGATDMTDQNFLETRNIALMGTLVTNGSATGIIILTGGNTVMGRIAQATNSVKDQPTLIQREINRFVLIIVCLTVCLASLILFTWAGWLRRDHFAFMNVIAMLNDVMGCVVAFIPEGMPVAVALTLMIIARRMKSNNILPKGLSTVETLGCVNVLCSDKTGTLTENKMVVTSVAFLDRQMTADEVFSIFAEKSNHDTISSFTELQQACILCNDASFDVLSLDRPVPDREIQGNATDGAALRFGEMLQEGSSRDLNDQYPRTFQVPFNSKNKWMLTLHKSITADREDCDYLLYLKGAPDVLLPRCNSYWSYERNGIVPLDSDARGKFVQLQERLSRNGERVILLCQRHAAPKENPGTNVFGDEVQEIAQSDMTIIALLGITDPPRKETAATVAACRRAGIRFFMVTGDFGLTSAAIAREIGIFTNEADADTFESVFEGKSESDSSPDKTIALMENSRTSLLLEGTNISKLSDVDWDIVCQYQEIVFARTSPEQKLRIVKEFRARDYAVAVTGDGVNDAPALRAADVGIAVVTGSDVALEAADLVLLDKFDSIIDAIRLGRLVFQNLQKVIGYLLPAGSWSEIWPVLINVFFGVPLPLSSFLMIIICVFTDLFVSLSLIMEKQEFDLLDLPPRNHKKDHLINFKIYAQSYLFIGVMETVIAHSMFFFYMWRHAGIPISALFFAYEGYSDGFYGYSQEQLNFFNTTGQCVYFVALVILQWGNILSIRNKRLSILQADPIRKQRRNPWLLAGAMMSLAIAVFVTEEPGIQSIFGTAGVPIEFWLIPLPLALGILMMDEIRKLIVRIWPKGPLARIAW